MIIVDLDDFTEDNNALDMLFRLRAAVPNFRVNLFTIPGLCSFPFVETVRKIDWIDMIPHGYKHPTSRECEHWTYSESREYLEYVMYLGFTKGFKAPGWQISDGMYEALWEFDFWVADQAYNNHRRPPELWAYILDQPWKVHGHIGHMGGYNANALEFIYDDLLKWRGEFMFIKDLWSK